MIATEAPAYGTVRDEYLDFDGGNNWETVAPFLDLPSWWRRFMFRVLKPREFQIYCYIISYCGSQKISRPLIRHIKADLDVANTTVIHTAINKLVDLGFLLKDQSVIGGRMRNVYKRPSLEFTLLRLLETDAVDGNLVPKKGNKNTSRRDNYKRSLGSVSKGLLPLLGNDKHEEWKSADDLNKAAVLYRHLASRLKDKRSEFEAKKKARANDPEQMAADKARKDFLLNGIFSLGQIAFENGTLAETFFPGTGAGPPNAVASSAVDEGDIPL